MDLAVQARGADLRQRHRDQSRRIVHNLGVEGRAPVVMAAQVVHTLLEEEVRVSGCRLRVRNHVIYICERRRSLTAPWGNQDLGDKIP